LEFEWYLVKRGIAFRWEDRTIDFLNQGANKTNQSKTAFAENAIELYNFIVSKPVFKKLTVDEIKEKIAGMLESDRITVSSDTISNYSEEYSQRRKRQPGYVINLIFDYIKEQNGNVKTTNEIAKELNVPKSTVRSYLRKILERYPYAFELIEGRPNQIRYIGSPDL
jgi:predicted transcriptional regulator